MNAVGSVIIEGAGGAGRAFRVRLDPPDEKWPDATFTDHRKAMGHAGGIRMVTGRVKRDLSGGG